MLTRHSNPLVARALHTANMTRTAKKVRKKSAAAAPKAATKLKSGKKTKGYPWNTNGINGDIQPIGTMIPGVGGEPDSRLWDKKRGESGDPRFRINKPMKRRMNKAVRDPGVTFKIPRWVSGVLGINTVAKSIANNHGSGGWPGGTPRVLLILPRSILKACFLAL